MFGRSPGTPVEDKGKFGSPEEEVTVAIQGAKDVSIEAEDHMLAIVPHRVLALVDPYAIARIFPL